MHCLTFSIIAFLLPVSTARAGQIFFQSDVGATNQQSDGTTRLNASFTFALGSFRAPFLPSAANVGDWNTHWVALDAISYNGPLASFSGNPVLRDNGAPFSNISDKVYIWGFNGLTSGSEWILVSKPSWRWPVATAGIPTPGGGVSFLIDNAASADAIVGKVKTAGVHMQTARVTFGELTYAAWRAAEFSSGEQDDLLVSGPHADPDMDGFSNLLEFGMGTSPKLATAESPVTLLAGNRLQLRRTASRAISWVAEASSNLGAETFLPAGSELTIVSENTAQITYSWSTTAGPRRFFRFRATLP